MTEVRRPQLLRQPGAVNLLARSVMQNVQPHRPALELVHYVYRPDAVDRAYTQGRHEFPTGCRVRSSRTGTPLRPQMSCEYSATA